MVDKSPWNTSLRSKRSRTKRPKFGPCLVFHIQDGEKWGDSKKVEGRGWERGKKGTLPSSPPPPFCHLFALVLFFARPNCEKLHSAARISFASYGNACYAGYWNTNVVHKLFMFYNWNLKEHWHAFEKTLLFSSLLTQYNVRFMRNCWYLFSTARGKKH